MSKIEGQGSHDAGVPQKLVEFMTRNWSDTSVVDAQRPSTGAQMRATGCCGGQARHLTGLSQAELAAHAEVPRSMISAYERDVRQPTMATFF